MTTFTKLRQIGDPLVRQLAERTLHLLVEIGTADGRDDADRRAALEAVIEEAEGWLDSIPAIR